MMPLRQIIDALATPLGLALLLVALALVAWLRGRPRGSHALLICTGLLAYLCSIPLVGRALLRPLESRYPPLSEERPPPAEYIVVLGSGYAPHDGIPVTAALDDDGLVRVVEAVRLARLVPAARLVVSGGAPPGRLPPAQGYARLARALGIAPQSIIVSDEALDTRGEARAVSHLLGHAAFLLVTSAYHMPRAMWVMRQAGANPIAAPTGERAYGAAAVGWRALLPGSGGLRDSERALHEYLGLAAIAAGVD